MNRFLGMIAAVGLMVGMMSIPTGTANAQWILLEDTAHTMVEQGLDYMYNVDYDKADEIFQSITEMYPENPAGYFLLALTDWWRIKPNIEDKGAVERYSKSFEERLDKTIDVADALLEEDEWDITGLFFKGAAYGYRARLKATNSMQTNNLLEWRSIFLDANEGRKMLIECQRLAPGNSDVLLGSGIFNYFAEWAPEKYPALKAVSLPPGDKSIGLEMLRIASEKALYSKVEADYALIEILTNNENNHRASLEISRRLHEKYPNNPDFHKYYARNLYGTSSFDQAEKEWRKILKYVKDRKNGFELTVVRQGLYYLGDIQIRRKNAKDAVRILTEGIKVHERLNETESGYYIASLLRLGNAYDLLGNRKSAIEMYEKVLDVDDIGNRHAKAEQYLKTPYK